MSGLIHAHSPAAFKHILQSVNGPFPFTNIFQPLAPILASEPKRGEQGIYSFSTPSLHLPDGEKNAWNKARVGQRG